MNKEALRTLLFDLDRNRKDLDKCHEMTKDYIMKYLSFEELDDIILGFELKSLKIRRK